MNEYEDPNQEYFDRGGCGCLLAVIVGVIAAIGLLISFLSK